MLAGIGEGGVSSPPSSSPEPQPVPLLTLQPVVLLHVWFLPLGLPHSARVSSFVTSFKCAPVGSSQVSLPASLTLLSSGQGTVGLSQNPGCISPSFPRTATHQNYPHSFPEKPSSCPLAPIARDGDSWGAREHRQPQTFSEPASSGWDWEKHKLGRGIPRSWKS